MLFTVSATDADNVGTDSTTYTETITYTLDEAKGDNKAFAIDGETGAVTLKVGATKNLIMKKSAIGPLL